MIDMAMTVKTELQDLPNMDYLIWLLKEVIQDGSVLIAKHFCEVLLNRANKCKDPDIAKQLHSLVSTFSKVVARELGKSDPNESEDIDCVLQD